MKIRNEVLESYSDLSLIFHQLVINCKFVYKIFLLIQLLRTLYLALPQTTPLFS